MFDFFGTFLDGPLKGCTFGGTIGDSAGGFDILPVFNIGAMLSVILLVIGTIVIAPFASWTVLLADVKKGEDVIISLVIMLFIELIYMIFRVRSNVKHWDVSLFKEILYNMVYFFVWFMFAMLVLIIPISFIYLGEETGNLIISHYGELVGELFSVLFSFEIFRIIFFFGALSVIPSLITTGLSTLVIGAVAKAAKVKR